MLPSSNRLQPDNQTGMRIPALVIVVAVAQIAPADAFNLGVRSECESAWFGSPEWLAANRKSASEKAIAKHDAIEKCVREMTAHMEGNTDPGQALQQKPPGSAAPEESSSVPAADTDPRLLDQSWKDEWEKRWLCDGLTLYKSGDRGKVVLDSIGEISTQFTLSGLNPRCNWNAEDDRKWDKEDGFRYAVVIQRDLLFQSWSAAYVDFALADEDGLAEPRMICSDCND